MSDDPDMRLYLRSCLRPPAPVGRLLDAANGIEALHILRAQPVDLVVAAASAAGLDGRRLTRAIRSDPALRHVAVLLIGDDAVAGAEHGEGMVIQPFNSGRLLSALDRLRPTEPDAT